MELGRRDSYTFIASSFRIGQDSAVGGCLIKLSFCLQQVFFFFFFFQQGRKEGRKKSFKSFLHLHHQQLRIWLLLLLFLLLLLLLLAIFLSWMVLWPFLPSNSHRYVWGFEFDLEENFHFLFSSLDFISFGQKIQSGGRCSVFLLGGGVSGIDFPFPFVSSCEGLARRVRPVHAHRY